MKKIASMLFFACVVLSPLTPVLGAITPTTITLPPNVRSLRFTAQQAAWTLNVSINISRIPAAFPKVIVYCLASSMVRGQYTVEAAGSVEQALDATGGFVGRVPVYLATVGGMDPTQATDWGCLGAFVDAKGNVTNGYGPAFSPQLKSGGLFISGPLPQ